MILVAGMPVLLPVSKVMLAGTQMAAVLAFASKIGVNEENTAIGTTLTLQMTNCKLQRTC